MIKRIQLQNFKSLQEVDIELRPLNILMGLNSSGKSSLLQALLLLYQSSEINEGRLLLRGATQELFNAGIAEDVYYRHATNNRIGITLHYAEVEQVLSWQFAYQPQHDNRNDYLQARETYTTELLNQTIYSQRLHYLQAERVGAKDGYPASNYNVLIKKTLGITGEHTPYYLNQFGNTVVRNTFVQHPQAASRRLIHQTIAWLNEISPNVGIVTSLNENRETVELRFKYGDDSYKPKNVGFGLSYALPVIVALLNAQPNQLLLIENPESHIHPKGQAAMGRLLALAEKSGAQLIIETHSDHIINGIRVAVRQQEVEPEKIAIFFHEQNNPPSSNTQISPIHVDINGQLSYEPANFLDEWQTQLYQLI
ncbi:MAG: DUF3696 domain-containing protein [Chitinophagales bacterium]|nr:DUF3696 domain-containing protein [Chitinophagales bacterium]